MSQLTRLTPDTPFVEAEGGKENIRKYSRYGTPWPLSEDDYLCVYDAAATNRGIYWLDRFGNRQLLYRDPAISCLSPIPLRAATVSAGDSGPDGANGRGAGRARRDIRRPRSAW